MILVLSYIGLVGSRRMNEEKMARHLFRIDILFRSNQATAISFDKYISLKQKVWNANDRNTAPPLKTIRLSTKRCRYCNDCTHQVNGMICEIVLALEAIQSFHWSLVDWSTKTRIGSPQRQRLTELPPICKCSPSQPALHPRRLQFI